MLFDHFIRFRLRLHYFVLLITYHCFIINLILRNTWHYYLLLHQNLISLFYAFVKVSMALFGFDIPLGKGADDCIRRREVFNVIKPYVFSEEDLDRRLLALSMTG